MNDNSTSTNDSLAITQAVFSGISEFVSVTGVLFGTVIQDAVKSGHQMLIERRRILQENLNGLFNLDTNKNTNLGFVIILGIAIVALIGYKFTKELKK